MPPISPEDQPSIRPHPLAQQLIERLHRDGREGPILDFAAGSGRNTNALRQAGFEVVSIPDSAAHGEVPLGESDGPFAAAISTHGFLHGTRASIEHRLASVANVIPGGGLLYATFGSTNDARFGRGTRIDEFTYAPLEGDEIGVAHAYYDRIGLECSLSKEFVIESLEERGVDEVAGSWAHRARPLSRAVHWFAALRRSTSCQNT
jgi:hypothetical protein